MMYFAYMALAAGFGVGIAAFGSALGLAKATAAAVEATARQPEAAGNIRQTMLLGGALIEALTIYCLLVSLLFIFTKMPTAEAAIAALPNMIGK